MKQSQLQGMLTDALGSHRDSWILDTTLKRLSWSEFSAMVDDFVYRIDGLVREGDRVVLLLDKSVRLLAAEVACIIRGCVSVPIDPRTSSATLQRIVDASTPRIVIERADTDDLSINSVPRSHQDPELFGSLFARDPVASILFTSGSTGEPKGVMVTHRSIANLAEWGSREFSLDAGSVVSCAPSLHFAASLLDVYGSIQAGSSLCLLPETMMLQPAALVRYVTSNRVTYWASVPSIAMQFLRSGEQDPLSSWTSLKTFIFNGERFPSAQLTQLVEALATVRIVQLYACTETNVCCMSEIKIEGMDAPDYVAPIGAGCANHRVTLANVDEFGIGEICVEGPGVTPGYWPAADVRSRSYDTSFLTGDFARLTPAGALVYEGRRDSRVKVRGRRVDLNAIEVVGSSFAGVSAAVAVPFGVGMSAGVRLYVEADRDLDVLSLWIRLNDSLLPSGLPDEIRVGPIARTARGKLDRVAMSRQVDT